MAWDEILDTEVDRESPIDENLMKDKIKNNDDDHESRILALEGSSGGGGGAIDSGAVGEITVGGETNEARYWKRRFSILEHMLNSDPDNRVGFDPEGKEKENVLLQFMNENDGGLTLATNASAYMGYYVNMAKDSSISFKKKKGVNFFSILTLLSTSTSNGIEVYIDNQTPTSLGLEDENGNAAPDSFSNLSATAFFQTPHFYYGLDENKEQVITIVNNDSGSNVARLEAFEVGYRSEDYSIDETIRISEGKAVVRGSEVSFNEETFTVGKTEQTGHTSSIVCDSAGALSLLDGECPAMTQVKAEESISFSSAVTSLPVKTNLWFPTNGICILSTPYGNHHAFSYTGKTDTSIQSHTLDGLLWQSQPQVDHTPMNNFAGAALEGTGDLNINYWGTAPILIDSTNNKIDFEVTLNGTTTLHAATIANGRYAADIVPIGAAISDAMQTAKPINGSYDFTYHPEKQLWSFNCSAVGVTEVRLLFSTGANVANSVHPTIGFSTSDFTGALSYIGSTEVQHLCCKTLEPSPVYISAEHPSIKYSAVNSASSDATMIDLKARLNLGPIKEIAAAGLAQIYVDDDCSGLEVTFARNGSCAMMTFQIDDGPYMYLSQMDSSYNTATAARGVLQTVFISFPRGSKKISIRNEIWNTMEIVDNSSYMYLVNARQYYTKPAYEKLSLDKAVIKAIDVSPSSLYATTYGHNGGTIYSPTVTDSINSITESASWLGSTASAYFNQGYRYTSVIGSYVDIDFTIAKDGGGILLKTSSNTNNSKKVGVFIRPSLSAPIVEATDRVTNVLQYHSTLYYDQDCIGLKDLKAGDYVVRFKHEDTVANTFNYWGIVIIDGVTPEENKNTITDVTGTGQGISYPVNVKRTQMFQDSAQRMPEYLSRTAYKEGRVSNFNYSAPSPTYQNFDDSTNLWDYAENYFGLINETGINTEYLFQGFWKAVSPIDTAFTTLSVTMQPKIDGINTLNTYSQRVQVKGGTAPSGVRTSAFRGSQKVYKLSCSFNSGNTFDVADTRGIRVGQKIRLYDGTNYEEAIIASVVIGVSFDVVEARSVVVDANVTEFEFHGFHSYGVQVADGVATGMGGFEYEPLKLNPSRAMDRRSPNFKWEKVGVTFLGLTNNQDASYPIHSDGEPGDWSTSVIQIIGNNAGAGVTMRSELKNIQIGSGFIDLKIDSMRLVHKPKEKF